MALLAIGTATTAAAGLFAAAAQAESPTTACRQALTDRDEFHGVCLWAEQDFQGEMTVLTNFQGTDKCGNLSPTAKSAVNLSDEEHLFYQGSGCQWQLFVGAVQPWESRAEFKEDAAAGSWR
ncbi:hypothetical protein CG736_06040 [Kitasatospora sp. CB02891]|nr:hypothetical protein CG736_06040 [Kitasatospora sp. CB02891]